MAIIVAGSSRAGHEGSIPSVVGKQPAPGVRIMLQSKV